MAKHRNVKSDKKSLINYRLTQGQQNLTIYTVSKYPDIVPIINIAGLSKALIFTEIVIYHDNNQKNIWMCFRNQTYKG